MTLDSLQVLEDRDSELRVSWRQVGDVPVQVRGGLNCTTRSPLRTAAQWHIYLICTWRLILVRTSCEIWEHDEEIMLIKYACQDKMLVLIWGNLRKCMGMRAKLGQKVGRMRAKCWDG